MDKISIGILGIAHIHCFTYIQCILKNPRAQIIGIYDDSPKRLDAMHKAFGLPQYRNPQELLCKNPDLVIICSETNNHLALVTLVAQAGIDIICEKPLAATVAELEGMLALAKKYNIHLMTAFPNRYIHSFISLKKAYEEERFGEILGIKATNKGEMPGSWFVDKSLSGGGCIIDHTVHVADLLNTLFDSMPLSVQAFGEHRLYPRLEVEDVALVTMRYPNGVKVSLDSSWSRMPSYPYSRDLTLHVVGTKDCCRINYFAESYHVYSLDANKAVLQYYGEDKDQKMIDDLIDCYQKKISFPITGLQGCKSALVAIAALKSTELSRPVFLSEIITPELKEFLQ